MFIHASFELERKYNICSAQFRNLRNLEIAQRILGIPKLRANLEIAQTILRLRKRIAQSQTFDHSHAVDS